MLRGEKPQREQSSRPEGRNGKKRDLPSLPTPASMISANSGDASEETENRARLYIEAVEQVKLDLGSLFACEQNALALSASDFEKVKKFFSDFHKKIHAIEQGVEHLRKTGTMSDSEVA